MKVPIMSDEKIAGIGRRLAYALMKYAHDREQTDRHEVGILQHELCSAVTEETRERAQQPEIIPPNNGR